jgi:hypothetical protein
MMSNASSGVVCSILSNVNPATQQLNSQASQLKDDFRTIVDNMIDLAVLSTSEDPTASVQRFARGITHGTHLTVASTIFFGKSSAPTSPATPIASPPAATISATTASCFLASMLFPTVISVEMHADEKCERRCLLAENDFCALLGE